MEVVGCDNVKSTSFHTHTQVSQSNSLKTPLYKLFVHTYHTHTFTLSTNIRRLISLIPRLQ